MSVAAKLSVKALVALCVLGLVVMQTGAPAAADERIFGASFRVVDGDTLHIDDNKIRLAGIDAPERDQICYNRDGEPWACGKMATAFLTGVLAASDVGVECVITGRDRYQRLIGSCFVGNVETNIDVQKLMVRFGLAVAEYADTYRVDEIAASRDARGIWAGTFVRPKVWRQQKKKRN